MKTKSKSSRDSFTFFVDWLEALKSFPPEVQIDVIKAAAHYASTGSSPEFKSDVVSMAFSFIKTDIDVQIGRAVDVSLKRKKAVEERWNKVRHEQGSIQTIQMYTNDTNVYNCIQKYSNVSNANSLSSSQSINYAAADFLDSDSSSKTPFEQKEKKQKKDSLSNILPSNSLFPNVDNNVSNQFSSIDNIYTNGVIKKEKEIYKEKEKAESEKSNIKTAREEKKDIARKFVPPTYDEVKAYCDEKGFGVDAETFVDFYASKGWMVGKNRMKDWRAAVRTWVRHSEETKPKQPEPKPKLTGYDEFYDKDGNRTYGYGRTIVPMDAPPRPANGYAWSGCLGKWVCNY